MCRAAIPHMLAEFSGKIINVSSVWGERGASMEVAYSASKGGLDAFTKALAESTNYLTGQIIKVDVGWV